MEIGEAPPAADEASQFRGSGTIGTPNGRGNRNAATVTAAKNGSRLFAAVRGAWAAVSGFAALRMPHPPWGEKSAALRSRSRGAGLGGQDWWIFEPNESVLFDNFNASRLRARNVGGALSILRIAK